jgi:hypothetical protein
VFVRNVEILACLVLGVIFGSGDTGSVSRANCLAYNPHLYSDHSEHLRSNMKYPGL